jgi:hypothetical protein
MRTAPRPVAVAPHPHRDLADANRKPHANAPQRDRLPTFNRCEPHRSRTEVGCPACNVADAPRPGRGSAARCRMRTATQPQPNRDRRAACRRSWSTANRTETGCRSTAAAPRPGRCEPQAARERSAARPVADVQPMRTASASASAPRSVAQRATLPMHRDLAEVARHVAECEPLRIRSRTETDALPADVPGQLRTAPRPVAVAPQPHRDLADANRKPHANAPQRDRLPTFNRCEPHPHPHPHRGRLPSVQRCRCTETWPR